MRKNGETRAGRSNPMPRKGQLFPIPRAAAHIHFLSEYQSQSGLSEPERAIWWFSGSFRLSDGSAGSMRSGHASAFISAFAGLCVGGCSLTANLDEEMESSIVYDDIPCAELVVQRDQLAGSLGLNPSAERDPALSDEFRCDIGPATSLLPDLRSHQAKKVGRAKGKIEAMNRSLVRRECTG